MFCNHASVCLNALYDELVEDLVELQPRDFDAVWISLVFILSADSIWSGVTRYAKAAIFLLPCDVNAA
jgi:hypothetical protein